MKTAWHGNTWLGLVYHVLEFPTREVEVSLCQGLMALLPLGRSLGKIAFKLSTNQMHFQSELGRPCRLAEAKIMSTTTNILQGVGGFIL